MPFDRAQVASCGSLRETVPPHGDRQDASVAEPTGGVTRGRKRQCEPIVAWDERIALGDGVVDRVDESMNVAGRKLGLYLAEARGDVSTLENPLEPE